MTTTSETDYEIIDGGTNKPMSIEERISTAASSEEIKSLLTFGNNCRPSGATRRKWLRAANARYIELGSAEGDDVVNPVINLPLQNANV